MTIKQQGGIFGRNPTFKDVEIEGSLTVGGSPVSGTGTIASQDADSVNIDGGAIDGTTIGGTTAAAADFTTLNASGATALAGSVVINDSQGDNDFRVESDNNEYQIFSDASADKVGINTNTLNATANVGTYNVWEDDNQLYADNIKRLQIMEKSCTTNVAEDFFSVTIPGRLGGNTSYRSKGMFEIELHVRGDSSHESGFAGKYILAYRNGDSYIGLSASITTIMEIGTAPTLAANVSSDTITFTVQLPVYSPQHDRLVTAWLYNKDRYLDVTQL